ncbi:Extracellular solute-binding protein family 1 [Desulfamplus magnetovallimortis]|uniref:Extracellular solute-binding protein family 1 n=1 Tax=Desulfamplus magnetovallimortis TaxID=1246637 RepID=A0A1W1H797_9BACT|nr:substrate-binding domain-containing protein [Desulfamplus magnetovallimortis]SLM28352.1 Extracellular solute-binding protein family 1 [Desulfamplus magnetovallimortis]
MSFNKSIYDLTVRSSISRHILIAVILISSLLVTGCEKEHTADLPEKKELLIFCGITMIKPMLEIAKIIEKEENVNITITKGGSGNLLKSIIYTKTGDLYLPGSDQYYKTISSDYPCTILETVHVGHNRASIMVQKGNPLGITNDLANLAKKEYAVVIGNAKSGSIGKETQKILEKRGIYDLVLQNAMLLTTDSKDLARVIVNKEADLVINWHAVSTWEENRDYMDVLDIDPQFSEVNNLVLGLLKFSRNMDTARKFMAFAASEEGHKIFKKYGLFFQEMNSNP